MDSMCILAWDMRSDISFLDSYVKSNTMESSLRLWSTISDQ